MVHTIRPRSDEYGVLAVDELGEVLIGCSLGVRSHGRRPQNGLTSLSNLGWLRRLSWVGATSSTLVPGPSFRRSWWLWSQRSASIAAWQPMPAAVTAWR